MSLKKILKSILESFALAASVAYPLPPDAFETKPEAAKEPAQKEQPKPTPKP